MSKQVTLTEEQFEEQLNITMTVGQAAAYENMAKTMRTRAGELFANGKDEQAKWLRQEAEEAERTAKTFRSLQRRMQEGADESWRK